LRDDAASHLVYVPEGRKPPEEPKEPRPPEPDATGAELG
jgi:hypothetical protein